VVVKQLGLSVTEITQPFAYDRPFPLVLDQNIGRAWNAKVFLKATFGKWQFSVPLSRINQKKATAFKMMNFSEITCAKVAVKVALNRKVA